MARVFGGILLLLLVAGAAPAALADSSPGTWGLVAPLPGAREQLALATGTDGRVYAIGGVVCPSDARSCYTSSALAYDPRADAWATVASMARPRSDLMAASGLDGRIYAIGGYDALSYQGVGTTEAYDPKANTWTTVAPMPIARMDGAAAAGPDGRIYVMGGYGNACGYRCTTAEAYDPRTNTWASLAPMPTGRERFAAVVGPDGLIYTIGGEADAYSGLRIVEAYDPKTNSWACSVGDAASGCTSRTLAPLLDGARDFGAAIGRDGKLYAIHEAPQAGPHSFLPNGTPIYGPSMMMEVYDFRTNTWTEGPTPGDYVTFFPAAAGGDGNIYLVGGTKVQGTHWYLMSDVQRYTVAATPSPHAPCAFMLGFSTIARLIPSQVGACIDDEAHDPSNGDAIQHTTHGLLVWRKADNWTAFTDGYHTWVNGPNGPQERLNTQRFPWEANPDGLPVAR